MSGCSLRGGVGPPSEGVLERAAIFFALLFGDGTDESMSRFSDRAQAVRAGLRQLPLPPAMDYARAGLSLAIAQGRDVAYKLAGKKALDFDVSAPGVGSLLQRIQSSVCNVDPRPLYPQKMAHWRGIARLDTA